MVEAIGRIIESYWPHFLVALDIALAVSVTLDAVLRKRNTRSVVTWVGFAWLAPLVGSAAYYVFGINRIQRGDAVRAVSDAWEHLAPVEPTLEDQRQAEELARLHPGLVGQALMVQGLAARPILPGNDIQILRDGDEAFPAMLEAIHGATKSVALLSYIFDSDRVGQMFLDALVEAEERGVEVRVLIDDVGARYSRVSMISRLQAAGVTAVAFLPSRTPRLLAYANLRNHRKILVVDGEVGFTGGTNIREDHWMSLQPSFPVSCLHFRFKGPVVRHLQQVFAIDWGFAAGESLHDEDWFPPLESVGSAFCRGIPHGPDEDFEVMQYTLMGAITVARERVRIVTPYFLPDGALMQALHIAAMKGVRVEILLPARNNIRLVEWASQALYEQLLELGCEIYESPPPFDHTKLCVVDGVWSLVGSTNWDPRSLRLNFEFNVECYDVGLAKRLEVIIDEKIAPAERMTLAEVRGRSLSTRLRNGLARLCSPYL